MPRLPLAHEEAPRGLRIGAQLIIPLGLALSCIAHLALLTPAVYIAAHPFDPAPADAITVDIVSADDTGELPKTGDAAAGTADTNAADAKTAAAPVAAGTTPPAEPQSQRPQPAQPQPQPLQSLPPQSPPAAPAVRQGVTLQEAPAQAQPAEPAVPAPAWLSQFTPSAPGPVDAAREPDAADVFAMPLTLPGGRIGYEYQGVATEKPNVSDDVIAAFRKQLKTCSTLPPEVTARARVTLRINLNPDGSLVKSPENPHAVGNIVGARDGGGGELFNAAMAAVRRCQPYKMLPPGKYAEWKTLDIPFTRDNF